MRAVVDRHILSPEELEQRLNASQAGTEGRPLRSIKCPVCGHYLLDVYGHDHSYVRVKCRKCKFDEVIDTALFRTMKKQQVNRLKAYANALGKGQSDE